MAQTFSFEEALQPAAPGKTSSFDTALQAEGVTGKLADVARSIYTQESGGGKNTKTSNAGAVGGMQIIPPTFASVADKGWDINNPEHNTRAGIRYLKQLDQQSGGDPALTAAGYYGGPGGMEKARKGIAVSDPRNPGAPNTLQYGQQVAARIPKGAIVQALDKMTDIIIPSASAQEVPGAKAGPAPATFSFEDAMAPAPGAAPAAPKRSMIQDLGRQLGLTVRAGVNGVAAIPAMAADAVTGPINAGLDAVAGKGEGFRFKQAGRSLDDAMTAAGLPKPENAQERVVQDAASAVAGAGGMIKGGLGLANYAKGPVTQAVGKMLSTGPGLQLASAAAGAGASGATREAGGGAGAQLAAGLAGSMLPSVAPFARDAGIRGIVRGGEKGRRQVQDAISVFDKAAGTTPTVGQATGSHALQAAETGLTNTIGSSGVMIRRGEIQSKALDDSVRKLSAALAPDASGVEAGGAITSGVNAFRDSMKTTQQRLYSQLDRHIPADTAVSVNKTQQALQSLNEGIDGAPSISSFFKNAKISSIERALLADLDAASTASIPTGLSSAGMAKVQGQLPYQAIQKLRSMVGRELADSGLMADIPRSKYRAVYSALTDDMGEAAQKAGPQAQQAWERANKYTRLGMQRIDELETIVKRDTPEKIFKAATAGMADGGTTIKRVMSSLPMENRREVSAAVLQRLGRAKSGMQNDVADVFSSETFLTNLSAMSPAAKQALFGHSGFPGLREKVDQMARMASVRRDGAKVFSNPSGTARQAGMGAWVATLASGLATGNAAMIAGALGMPAVANIAAKRMTRPDFVRGLAQRTEMSPALAPAVLNAAAQVGARQDNGGQGAVASPQTFSFDDAQLPPGTAQPEPVEPAHIELGGMAQQPGSDLGNVEPAPQNQPEVVDSTEDVQTFNSQQRPDGTLAINGDPQALHAMLVASGIPARSIVRNAVGIMVGRSQAARVQEAITRMGQPSPEDVATGAVPDEMVAENQPTIAAPENAQSAPVYAQNEQSVPQNPAPDTQTDELYAQAPELAGQPIDGNWTAFSPESGTLRVPRADMPQIKAEHRGAMVSFLKARGIDSQQGEVHADSLKPTQAEFSPEKVARAAGFEGGDRSILISSDGHVLDGHHQWLAKREAGEPVKVTQLGAPIAELLGAVREFPSAGASEGAPPQDAILQAAAGGEMPETAQAEPAAEPVHPMVARIQRMKDAGEDQVAKVLQRNHDHEQLLGAVQTELAGLRDAAPDLPHHQNPHFQDVYQQQRVAGAKPAEAAARAGILAAVQQAAPGTGMPEKAVAALQAKLDKMPVDEAPGFVQRFTQSLIAKGFMPEFQGADQIEQMLVRARDGSMNAMVDSAYQPRVS